MTKKTRIEIPEAIAAQVLFESDRTCCVCRKPRTSIQIHHIDDDPANYEPDNLAVLCLECHRDTQIRGGFDRKLDAALIARYRSDWVRRVAMKRDGEHGSGSRSPVGTDRVRGLRYLQMKENSEEYLYSFNVEYPQVETGDSTADAETNLSISAFVTLTLQRFRAEAMARKAEKDEMKRYSNMAWDDLSISHNVSLYTADLLSIEFQLSSYYAMAAHPNTHTRTLNYRLHPSLQLELKDIFKPSSDYLHLLSQYCVTDLHTQQPLRWYDPTKRAMELKNREDEWITLGAAPNPGNYEKFVLVRGGIRVFFDPYQVGSYAEGRYEVFIPSNVLAPVLDESMVPLLG
jgi:hypothetical protein